MVWSRAWKISLLKSLPGKDVGSEIWKAMLTQHLPSAPMCRFGPKNSVQSCKAQISLVATGSQWLTDNCPKTPEARSVWVEDDKRAGPASDLLVQSDLTGSDKSQSLGHPRHQATSSYQKNDTVDLYQAGC